jgi:hypothetical protein
MQRSAGLINPGPRRGAVKVAAAAAADGLDVVHRDGHDE